MDNILKIKDIFIENGCPKTVFQKLLKAYTAHVKTPFEKLTPVDFHNRLKAYITFYQNNGLTTKDFFKVLDKNPFLIFQNMPDIQNHLTQLSELTGVSKTGILKGTLRYGQLLSFQPTKLASNLTRQAELLQVDKDKYIEVVMRLYPQMASLLPQTICQNVENISKILDIEPRDFITAGMKQPQLFARNPQSLTENMLKTCQLLNVMPHELTTAYLKQPTLFYLLPEYLNKNVTQTAHLFGCSKSDVVRSGLKFPQLFYAQPSTVGKKYRFYRQMFKHGLIRLTNEENTPENIQKYLLKNALAIMLGMDNLHLRCAYGRYLKQYTGAVDTTPLSKPKYKIIKALQNAPKLFKDRNPVAMRIIRQSNEKH